MAQPLKKMDMANGHPKEDIATRSVENLTVKIPSIGFLGLAVGSMIASAYLEFGKDKKLGNFVGLWAPSFLILGLYNKVAKIEREILDQRKMV